MARLARITVPGYPHLVLQRGNYDQQVFDAGEDYQRYLDLLQECKIRYGVEIWAYCLMFNHVHVICVPRSDGALAKTFNTTHMRYAQYINSKRGVTGHLWRARFMSCVMDGPSVHEMVRFIETSPVRTGLVSRPDGYPWSSARSHVSSEANPMLSDGFLLPGMIPDWRAYLSSGGDEAVLGQVRARLRTGRPAGDPAFVRELEGLLGRRLMAFPRGRPRKLPPLNA